MKKLLLGTAAVAVLIMGADRAAHAVPAYAYSELQFQNFTLSGIFGLTTSGVTVTNTSVKISDGANYLGVGPNQSKFGNITSGVTISQATSGPGAFPAPALCSAIASCPNWFTQQMQPGSGNAGARGAGLITGPLAGGAQSYLAAEGDLTSPGGTASSNAGSTTSLTSTFTVTGSPHTVTLSFTATDYLTASVGQSGDNASSQVSASYDIVNQAGGSASICGTINGISVGCTTNVAPGQLNTHVSTGTPGFDPVQSHSGDTYFYTTTLAPGTYTLTVSDQVREQLATAPPIPEPASLAVFGVGLLGLAGAVRRRWKAGMGWRRSKT